MIAEIQDWLSSGQHYVIGVALYDAFGEDEALKVLFAQGPTDWNRTRLVQALQELASGTVAKQQHDEYGEMPESGDDGVLQALRHEWQTPYKVMQYKIHELDKYPDDDATSIAIKEKLAFEILDLEQQCMAIWARRDYYQKHGKLPEEPAAKGTPVLTDPVAIGRRIATLERNIRRNKKKASEHPDSTLYPTLVKQYEAELEGLKGGK